LLRKKFKLLASDDDDAASAAAIAVAVAIHVFMVAPFGCLVSSTA